MQSTETGVIVLAEVHVHLLFITEVLFKTGPMGIHQEQLVLIPIEGVQRLGYALVIDLLIDLILREVLDIQDLLRAQKVLVHTVVREVGHGVQEVTEAQEVLQDLQDHQAVFAVQVVLHDLRVV